MNGQKKNEGKIQIEKIELTGFDGKGSIEQQNQDKRTRNMLAIF